MSYHKAYSDTNNIFTILDNTDLIYYIEGALEGLEPGVPLNTLKFLINRETAATITFSETSKEVSFSISKKNMKDEDIVVTTLSIDDFLKRVFLEETDIPKYEQLSDTVPAVPE